MSTNKGESWSNWTNTQTKSYLDFKIPGSDEILSKDNLKMSEEVEVTFDTYQISSKIKDNGIVDMITKGTGNSYINGYWLATDMRVITPQYAIFGIPCIYNGKYTSLDVTGPLYMATGCTPYSLSFYFRPVVTLEADIQLDGSSQDGWRIKK